MPKHKVAVLAQGLLAPAGRRSSIALTAALSAALGLAVPAWGADSPPPAADEPSPIVEMEAEKPDQPPGFPARQNALARSPASRFLVGPYESIQVNVDGLGENIVGDAANEPSLAVNPTNPLNMVVGWRQFDTIASNFRQAGWAYTFDGGQTWTFPGVLEPGVFRSDPVLDADSQGTFYYQSLSTPGGQYVVHVFRSTNGGVSWLPPVYEHGGDKNWMTVDRSGGPSDGHVYGVWQRFAACCGSNTFTRSTNDGASFETPVPVASSPLFGTLTVGPGGEVYVSGIEGTFGQDFNHFVVAKSTNASNPGSTPTFTGGRVNLGGSMRLGGTSPNPGGLLGQANVAVDRSGGPTNGNVYVAASVQPAGGGGDPLNFHMISSTNGGATWSPAVKINDDPLTTGYWHWFGAHSVAPNGRIDAIWNDTRSSGVSNLSELFYSYSWDAGVTWSPNIPVSPMFDSSLGYPNQNKMGDYDGIVSNATGADVAYTATFNGEQDVYYLRVFPDCNGNAVSDVTDLEGGSSFDCDANHVPDECQASPSCLGAGSVPDGAFVSGTLLTLSKAAGDVTLSWGGSCSGDPDYAVYEGTLGDFASHTSRFCTTGGLTTITFTPAGGGAYYLVVPIHADREGSYGKRSSGVERPQGLSACFPQAIASCP